MEHSKKQTTAKKNYDREYKRTKLLSISFRLHRDLDKDLIEIYDSIPNKLDWFKDCLENYKKA